MLRKKNRARRIAGKSYTHCPTSHFYEILNHSIRESRALFITHFGGRVMCPAEERAPPGLTSGQLLLLPRPRAKRCEISPLSCSVNARRLHAFSAIYCIIARNLIYTSRSPETERGAVVIRLKVNPITSAMRNAFYSSLWYDLPIHRSFESRR